MMITHLTQVDIIAEAQNKTVVQKYKEKTTIEGVKIIKINNHVTEDGDFSEIMRLGANSEYNLLPDFKVAQINRSRLTPGTIKAWHLHLRQDEIWYVPPQDRLLLALWDIRKNSSTVGGVMRVLYGEGESKLVYIPRGIAHGAATSSTQPAQVWYLVSEQFNKEDPDELRLPWNALGADFWKPPKE